MSAVFLACAPGGAARALHALLKRCRYTAPHSTPELPGRESWLPTATMYGAAFAIGSISVIKRSHSCVSFTLSLPDSGPA